MGGGAWRTCSIYLPTNLPIRNQHNQHGSVNIPNKSHGHPSWEPVLAG